MTAKEMAGFSGKQVRLTTEDGEVYIGRAQDFIPPQDNEPEEASISIGEIEFYAHEIRTIELIA